MIGMDMASEWMAQQERIASVLQVLARTTPRTLARMANQRIANEKYPGRVLGARFDTQGASGGSPWPTLSSATIRERARLGFGPLPVLIRTGTLKKAVQKGRDRPDTKGIAHSFKDGPGPTYGGKKKSTRLSVYAPALDKKRPFLQEIRGPEARGIVARFLQIVKNFYSNALDGKLS